MESSSERCTSKISRASCVVAGCALLVHLYAGLHYGFFRDELYYIACSKHLAWGYVDQPPLIALVVLIVRMVLGSSLFAIHLLPAVAAAAEVLMTAILAREFGGRRFAQVLAGLGVFVAPGILGIDSFLSMNAFEPLFWMGCAWLLIRILKTGNPKLWIWFGVLAGFGLENKYSMLIFGAGIVAGLVLTAQRRLLASPWPWIGFAIALAIFLPNLLWNIRHHFPFLELQANIRRSGGAVVCETWPVWLRRAWPASMVVTGAMLSPLAIPVLPPKTYIRYTSALHIGQPAIETHRLGPLPQIFADEFGWDEMAATVGRVYHNLPPEVRAKTAIFGQNYGQAGAIDFFGPRYGLPSAISGHQSYFLWGPRGYTGESVIVLDGNRKDLDRQFTTVEKVAHAEHPYSMPYEHFDVFYCRGLRHSFTEIWPQVKKWD